MSNRNNEIRVALENALTNIQLADNQDAKLDLINTAVKTLHSQFNFTSEDFDLVYNTLVKPLDVQRDSYKLEFNRIVGTKVVNASNLQNAEEEKSSFANPRLVGVATSLVASGLIQLRTGVSVSSVVGTAVGAVATHKVSKEIENALGNNSLSCTLAATYGFSFGVMGASIGADIHNRFFAKEEESETETEVTTDDETLTLRQRAENLYHTVVDYVKPTPKDVELATEYEATQQ